MIEFIPVTVFTALLLSVLRLQAKTLTSISYTTGQGRLSPQQPRRYLGLPLTSNFGVEYSAE